MRCACCSPVSPRNFIRKQQLHVHVGGDGDMDLIDDVVRDEDAGVESLVVVKQPKEEVGCVRELRSPKAMAQHERDEHLITHLLYCESCPFCISGRGPNRHHRRRGSSRDVPGLVADYGFLRAHDDDLCPCLGVLVRPGTCSLPQ